MLNIVNLLDILDNSIICNNCLYRVGNRVGNALANICINNENNNIYTYSNEWLHLIRCYYNHHSHYHLELVNLYNFTIYNKQHVTTIYEDMYSMITSFSEGTVHGYSGFFKVLGEYLNNKQKYNHCKIIFFKDSQSGLRQLFEYLLHLSVIDRSKVIYLDRNVTYHFRSVVNIPNDAHVYNSEIEKVINNYINNYIIPTKSDLLYIKSLNIPNNKNICILKGSNSSNLTGDGVIPEGNVRNFVNKWSLELVEPGVYDEIRLIHTINNSELVVISWGTSFLKNYAYISDNCKKIVVVVVGDAFIGQYNSYLSTNILMRKYKNAEIIYKISDINLNFNPYEI